MRLLTMNLYLTLLWGASALLSMETMSTTAPVPQTSSRGSTAEPNDATAQLSTSRVLYSESQTQIATRGPMHETAATAGAAASNATESREANVSSTGYGSNVSTTASSWHRIFTSATGATPSHNETTTGVAEPEPSASTGTTTAAAATLTTSRSSAASSASAAVTTLEAESTTEPGATQNLFSTSSSDHLTRPAPSTQSFSSPSASTGSTNTTNRTVEAPPAFDPTSALATKPETATTRAGLPSTPQPVSDAQTPVSTSKPPDTTAPSSSSGSPSPSDSITASSTSPAGIFIRPVSKVSPTSAATTTAAPQASQSPSTTVVQPCSSRGLVTQCLIIIASLAGLATIFMVSTVVLCAKASVRKYRAKRPKEETEMMCISALLPERNHTYTRQHNPVSNGVLVLPIGADSDDDMGDNLTLSSFLPENERSV